MKKYSIIALLFLLSFSAQAHKFYVSISQINYNQKNNSLEITLKLFTDDLEKSVAAFSHHPVSIDQSTDEDASIKAYILKNLKIEINNKLQTINYLGKELENDVSWCYLEIKNVNPFNELEITNSIFTDLFDNQKNLIQISAFNKEESTVLTKNTSSYTFKF